MNKQFPSKKVLTSLVLVFFLFFTLKAQIPTPAEHFGFTPGDDRMLFLYEDLMDYMKKLEQASPMVHIEEIGQTEMERPMYIVFVSSEENIQNLESLRQINRQLALDEIPVGTTREELFEKGKVFFLSTLSMHASEVGPTQAFPLVVYELIAGTDPRRKHILDNTVAMFIPHNPDGMNMIVEHYNKHKGTSLETSSMPGVYHKYVGHNINRDFVTLSQSENQAVAETYSTKWFPQAMIERHQMGSTGPRFYISPPHDPIAENVDAGIWNWSRVYGSRSLKHMTEKGLKSVSVNYLFDDYWPGATTTCIWKGVIGMLSEAASVQIATPIYIEPNELRTMGKGLGSYDISINMPKPWEGGWWRLSDIISYELENNLANLETSAIHKKEILQFRNDVTRREMKRGMEEAPFYFVLPQKQHDLSEMVDLVNLLHRHGVKTYRLNENVVWNDRLFKTGDVVIPLAQPYRAFIKEVIEKQKFPARYYSEGGEFIQPYDITSWSLPLHKGVDAVEINTRLPDMKNKLKPVNIPFSLKNEPDENSVWALFSSSNNESYKAAFIALKEKLEVERVTEGFSVNGISYPAGSFIVPVGEKFNAINEKMKVSPVYLNEKPEVTTTSLKSPRVGVVETWQHDMDGGWTRFLFDEYQIPYIILRPDNLQTANLQRDFDVLIFSDQPKSIFMQGKTERDSKPIPSNYPPEFAKGMEKKGFDNLMKFVTNGGKIMAWGPSTELFLGAITIGEKDDENKVEFMLPVSDIGKSLSAKGLYVPGSLLRLNFRNDHPLAWGMPEQCGVFHRGTPVFRTSIPGLDMDRRVVATFPEDEILMSGYAQKEELLKREAALIWVKKGKGQIVLSSFNPQFRASTPVTFKLLFNAVLLE
ncbi:M14 family zinc carboxypeptidase [Mariniphaga sp.]|uniref:M14 family zinc carboxypeptidase n=1 Tax=Mariniphaga sp. TaxID=1954475 RepID=UPI003567290D